jgi:hypothetical protein
MTPLAAVASWATGASAAELRKASPSIGCGALIVVLPRASDDILGEAGTEIACSKAKAKPHQQIVARIKPR